MSVRLRPASPGNARRVARTPSRHEELPHRRPSAGNPVSLLRPAPFGAAAILNLQHQLGNALAGRVLAGAGHPGAATMVLRRAEEDDELKQAQQATDEAAPSVQAGPGGEAAPSANTEAPAAETAPPAQATPEAEAIPSANAETPAAETAPPAQAAAEDVQAQAAAQAVAAEQEAAQTKAAVEAQETAQAKEQDEAAAAEAARDAQDVQQTPTEEPETGQLPREPREQGKAAPLPPVEDEGGPFPALGRGTVRLQGRTRASFAYNFRIENEHVEAATSCTCGRGDSCVHVTGTVVVTFTVTTRVTLPSVPAGLTACQRERVQDAITNTLSPHEDQHVAAFQTYNGTARLPFDETMCRSGYPAYVRGLARGEETTRRATAQAASDALDPFTVDVDLDCEDSD